MTTRTLRLPLLASLSVLALAACNVSNGDAGAEQSAGMTPTDGTGTTDEFSASADMAANDPAAGGQAQAGDDQPRPVMQLQVALDRMNFSPGVIDGKMGMSTELALKGFQEANGLTSSGKFDDATKQALAPRMNIAATRVVTVPAAFVKGPFNPIPDDPAKQAEMDRLGYNTAMEKLAERFHTTPEVILQLNPQMARGAQAAGQVQPGQAGQQAQAGQAGQQAQAGQPPQTGSATKSGGSVDLQSPGEMKYANLDFSGQKLRVPNIGNDRATAAPQASEADQKWTQTLATLGVGGQQPKATRIVGDKSDKSLKVFAGDKLIAQFQATMGSSKDPLPLGDWGINTVAKNTPFSYNPELFWDVPDDEPKQLLPPGPNGPVGVVWIDLTKEHYGIHGTPAPETIGRAESHGCVRLTNWDAARLAQMVDTRTKVVFQA